MSDAGVPVPDNTPTGRWRHATALDILDTWRRKIRGIPQVDANEQTVLVVRSASDLVLNTLLYMQRSGFPFPVLFAILDGVREHLTAKQNASLQ